MRRHGGGDDTGSGNATVIVTAAGMAGSPRRLMAVLNTDTPATWAGKVRLRWLVMAR